MARLGCRVRRNGVAQRRHRMARRAAAAAGARARALSVSPGRNAGVAARSSRRNARAMGRDHAAAPGRGARRRRCARARRLDGRRCRRVSARMVSADSRRTTRRFARSRCASRSIARCTNDAAADAAHIIAALKRGAVYSAIDAIAAPAALEFSASSPGHRINQGDVFSDTRGYSDVHSSHQCANRRSDRPSKRWTHPDAESVAGARRSKRRGRAPIASRCTSRSAPRRAADSVDRQQSHLRSARLGWGTPAPVSVGASDDHARHSGRAMARRKRRRVVCGDYSEGLSDRTRAVHVSSRGRRTVPGGTRRWALAWAKRSPNARTSPSAHTHRVPCACRFRPAIRNRATDGSARSISTPNRAM